MPHSSLPFVKELFKQSGGHWEFYFFQDSLAYSVVCTTCDREYRINPFDIDHLLATFTGCDCDEPIRNEFEWHAFYGEWVYVWSEAPLA